MKKKVWIWVIAILVVLGIAAAIIWSLNNKKVHMMDDELGEMSTLVQKASEELLTESILVTGKIVPEGEQKVFLEPEKGEVLEYKVTENQQVLAGDVLFEYDSSKLKVEYGKAIRERDLIQKRAKIEQSQIAGNGEANCCN